MTVVYLKEIVLFKKRIINMITKSMGDTGPLSNSPNTFSSMEFLQKMQFRRYRVG